MTIDYQALQPPEDPEQTVFTYTAAVGSPSQEAIRLLASWTFADLRPREQGEQQWST